MSNPIQLGTTLITNSAIIVAESFKTPGKNSIVALDTGDVEISRAPPDTMGLAVERKKLTETELSAGFKIALIVVGALTILSFFVVIGLAMFGPTSPSSFQQNLSQIADFILKAGFGGFLGMLGGKAT